MPKKIIAVAGIGYVGLPNAILLAQNHTVRAYDISAERVDMVNARQSPLVDPEIEQYLRRPNIDWAKTASASIPFKK